MAQLILSAASSAISGAGLGAALARTLASTAAAYAAGAAERLLFGPRRRTVEGPRIEQFALQASSEGAGLARVFGRARLAGQIIWATRFRESLASETQRSGKGGRLSASTTTVTEYLYSISFAVGLCEGPIDRVARVWADGRPFDLSRVNARVYLGGEDQAPDDLLLAVEGDAPAYRGTAYIVFEDLALKEFGNRIPQLSFEVERALARDDARALENALTAATIIPASGEFVYGTTPVTREAGEGVTISENVRASDGATDFSSSLAALGAQARNLGAVSLAVAWFGTDLSARHCRLRPGVETRDKQTAPYEWSVCGAARADAHLVSQANGAAAYGGTPSDRTVLEAIAALKARGLEVMLHPFILMDAPGYPWRGRISVFAEEGTAGARDATAAFFGTAAPADFSIAGGAVAYHGPDEWTFRRMVLHMANLAALAGGVESFLLGSELGGLTRARDETGAFPAVAALRALAADVRATLGPATKISYAANWDEYAGLRAADGAYFHLDPLWADSNIDFVGVDWYPPLADWRDGFSHADALAGAGGPYDRAYLQSNIEGGENYDWFYASPADRDAQQRTPVFDGAHGEHWIWRAKDLRGFWANAHYDRPNSVRAVAPTPWIPQSKPIRLTEIGAPAVDKAANAPNAFVDPKSDESALPPYSSGACDDLAQRSVIEAVLDYWRRPQNNPLSAVDGRPMVEAERAYVYAYDARPFPFFPARADIWGDAAQWARGHWLNGRLARAPIARLIEAIGGPGVAAGAVAGDIAGYALAQPMTARAALDPLTDIFQIDMRERPDGLDFISRAQGAAAIIGAQDLVDDGEAPFVATLAQGAELPAAFRLTYIDEGGDYLPAVAEARDPAGGFGAAGAEIAAAMGEGAAQARARSILADARVMRERARFVLPPSYAALEPGDTVSLSLGGVARDWRIVRIEDGSADGATRGIEAVRVSPGVYEAPAAASPIVAPAQAPVFGKPAFEVMNLPVLADADDPAHPYVAAFADPWPGAVAVRRGPADALAATLSGRGFLGRLEEPLPPAGAGRRVWRPLRVVLAHGALASAGAESFLAGANALAVETAIGWEVLQFETAALGAGGAWTLSGLLRGQRGTEACAAAGAAAGARVVVLNAAVRQASSPLDLRGLEQAFSAGPADDPPTAPTVSTRTVVVTAEGLLPLAPAHLRVRRTPQGLALSWVRRTRIGGDAWEGEAPLAEAYERYRVEVWAAGALVRAADVESPAFVYAQAEMDADFPGGAPPLDIRVAQLSDLAGAGKWARVAA